MRSFFILLRRELASWFFSPLAYILSAFFLLVIGFSFWMLLNMLVNQGTAPSVLSELFSSIFFWITLLVLVPVMTMRLLAEEQRNGTMETLMTAPITESAVVLAKFFGAFCAYALMWLPTLGYIALTAHYSLESSVIDPGPVLTGYFGALLVGAFYISVGLLASSLTRSQILAAVMSFSLLCVFFLLGFLPYIAASGAWRTTGLYVSSAAHMSDFARGVIDTRPLTLYLSGTVLALFASVRILEARKWR